MSVLVTLTSRSERAFCDKIRSYVGSPAYNAMLKSVDSYPLGSILERQFYLALHYFPRRFTAIHERLITLLSAAYLRSTRILNARFPHQVLQPVPDYVSISRGWP